MQQSQQFNEIWQLVLEELRKVFSTTHVDLWFSRLYISELTATTATVVCDEAFKYNILSAKYYDAIREAVEKALGYAPAVYLVDASASAAPTEEGAAAAEPVNLADIPQSGAPAPAVSPVTEAAPAYFAAGATAPRTRTQGVHPTIMNEPADGSKPSQVEYTFENFIVGSSNKFAHAACIAVAKDPAGRTAAVTGYNPLFIYGPSGLGKTHLLYAVINHIRSEFPSLKIVYVRGEEFTNQMVNSIADKTTEQFRAKYRKADVLLIDDIQFIAGREATQEEFFHTFNALYEDHKQIILTSDRPPRDIKTLEDRLKTRFEWGLTADIQPPDPDLRCAIIKSKAANIGLTLSNDVIDFLAESLKSNIRQFEGALKKLSALSLLISEPITVELARNSIADLTTGSEPAGITAERILEKVSRRYNVTVDSIKSSKRTKEIAFARHISIYLIRTMTDMSLPQIGKLLGRDHTTILSSLKTIERELGSNSPADRDIAELKKELKAH